MSMVEELKAAEDGTIGSDTETSSLKPHLGEIVGHCFGVRKGEIFHGFYVPVRHVNFDDNVEGLIPEEVEEILNNEIYWNTDLKKVYWNMKFDINFCKKHNITSLHNDDAMIACFLRDEREKNHKLKYLASKYVDPTAADEEKEVQAYMKKLGGFEKGAHYGMIPVSILGPYGAKDPVLTLKLWYLRAKFIGDDESAKRDGLRYSIYAHELKFTNVVMNMEYRGVPYDLNVAEEIWSKVRPALKQAQEYVYNLVGERFNIDSNPQLNAILVDKLGHEPVTRSTKTGEPAWGRAELLKLDNELGQCIAACRNLSHSLSLFDEGIKSYVHDGIIRCSYNQIGAKTGRASCSEPNLQQVAKRLPRYTKIPEFMYEGIRSAFKIRNAFRAPEGYKIVSIDESQFELRMLQHYAQDPGMAKAFAEGFDIHAFVAASIFDVDYSRIISGVRAKDDEVVRYRTVGKEIDFAVVYGAGDARLLQSILEYGFMYTLNEVKEFRRKYYARFSGIKKFIDSVQTTVRRRGYIFNYYGRHKHVEPNKAYVGVNYLIQGVTADMLKKSAVSCDALLANKTKDSSYLGLMVHDEILFIMRDEDLNLVPELQSDMEDFPWAKVPIVAEVSIGQSWGEQREFTFQMESRQA